MDGKYVMTNEPCERGLISRLRDPDMTPHDVGSSGTAWVLNDTAVLDDAADEIEALRKECARLAGHNVQLNKALVDLSAAVLTDGSPQRWAWLVGRNTSCGKVLSVHNETATVRRGDNEFRISLAELFEEDYKSRDRADADLCWALNSGDGSYKP